MSTNSLQVLFSDTTKKNYARLFRPTEFIKKQKTQKLKLESAFGCEEESSTETCQNNDTALNGQEKVSFVEKENRTCFVGNIGITESKKSILRFFKKFGHIESVRMRSVPIEGTAVDEDGNQDLVRKVCSNKRKFGDQKGSFNAYIVFKNAISVQRAISANNHVIGGRHIRVDFCKPSVLNSKRTIFVGSLPYYVDEEELRSHFAVVVDSGHDAIECVRVIRDPESLVGKGIAYVSFRSHDDVLKALTLDQSKFKKRRIRVSICGKRTKRSQQERKIMAESSPSTFKRRIISIEKKESQGLMKSFKKKQEVHRNNTDIHNVQETKKRRYQ